MHVLWQFGIDFFDTRHGYYDNPYEVTDEAIVFMGKKEDLTIEIASKVAALHPSYRKYYAQHLCLLYRIGNSREGTEDPRKAILGMAKAGAEDEADSILIFNILKQ